MSGEVPPCGTYNAYQRHVKHNEPTDPACKEANRLYGIAYRSKNPQDRSRYNDYGKARARALERLAKRYPGVRHPVRRGACQVIPASWPAEWPPSHTPCPLSFSWRSCSQARGWRADDEHQRPIADHPDPDPIPFKGCASGWSATTSTSAPDVPAGHDPIRRPCYDASTGRFRR